MKRPFHLIGLGLALLTAAALYDARPADAATYTVCRGARPGTAAGPARETGASGTDYTVDARGCARVSAADLGSFQVKGFVISSAAGVVAVTGITSSSSGNYLDLPAGAYIQAVTVEETSGTGVSGGIKVGTANGGAQVVSSLGINASSVNTTSSTLIRASFSRTAATRLYVDCVLSCTLINSSLNLIVHFSYFN